MIIVVKVSKEMLTQEFSSTQQTAISYFGLNQKLFKKNKANRARNFFKRI